ncbi:Hypothetical predicted protein [Olea europaea subsp. europaea]|uniref:Uncharacterized protein n=1 Tax=Olea europaea subsp. europaea TaxID=158383 RepID=A0A8S0Q1E7_OLEEU|nr:Hypothetical predicted protein [Olea europaea subsp. europaea]
MKTESTPFRDPNRRKARLSSDIRIVEPPAINDRHGSLHRGRRPSLIFSGWYCSNFMQFFLTHPFSHTFSSFIGIILSIALSFLSPPTKTESSPLRDTNRRKARLPSDIRIVEPPAINDRHGSLHRGRKPSLISSGHMEFEFLIPEDTRLRAHISQRSNLKKGERALVQCARPPDRFGLQEYVAVTGLRCGVFPEGDNFDRLIKRKRLKERFKAILEIGERFGQPVGERLPHIFRWSTRKQPQHRTYDAFFKNVQLHVYATLQPTDAEAEQPYLSSLVPYDDPPVPVLDDISGGQDLEDRVRSGRSGDGETSGDDESDGESGSDSEGDDSEDTGDSSTPHGASIRSPVRGYTTNSLSVRTSASSLTKGEVEELLLDQRILFEMGLRTVKFEIE